VWWGGCAGGPYGPETVTIQGIRRGAGGRVDAEGAACLTPAAPLLLYTPFPAPDFLRSLSSSSSRSSSSSSPSPGSGSSPGSRSGFRPPFSARPRSAEKARLRQTGSPSPKGLTPASRRSSPARQFASTSPQSSWTVRFWPRRGHLN